MARFTHPGIGNGSGVPGPTGPQGPKGDTGSISDSSYGSFYDVQTQALTQQQESTGFPVLIRSIDTDATKGFTVIDNSKMKAANAGVYNFAFSFQFRNTGGGGSGTTVEIWLRKNGTNVPDTNTRVTVNTNSPYVVSAWNFFQKLNSNDYVELYWATDNHHIEMVHNTGAMGGPAIPSAIITVNQVG
jgi:hypothetical protein